jgi:hypothetical protein
VHVTHTIQLHEVGGRIDYQWGTTIDEVWLLSLNTEIDCKLLKQVTLG